MIMGAHINRIGSFVIYLLSSTEIQATGCAR
jgi:hypothetical protein